MPFKKNLKFCMNWQIFLMAAELKTFAHFIKIRVGKLKIFLHRTSKVDKNIYKNYLFDEFCVALNLMFSNLLQQ